MTAKTGIAACPMPMAVGRLRIERLNHLALPSLRTSTRTNRHRNHQHRKKANYRSNPEFHIDNLLLTLGRLALALRLHSTKCWLLLPTTAPPRGVDDRVVCLQP